MNLNIYKGIIKKQQHIFLRDVETEQINFVLHSVVSMLILTKPVPSDLQYACDDFTVVQ